MKKIFIIFILFVAASFTACKKGFLDETPRDFLSGGNAYKTAADFNIAVNDMYRVTRFEFYTRNENHPFDYMYGCDIVFDGQPFTGRHTPMSTAYAPVGGGDIPGTHWSAFYKIISEANAIIDRAPGSSMTDAEKLAVTAKARFFRAFAYRSLAYLFGGVPLVLNEVTSPKTDFVRATRQQVYLQAIDDLKFAVTNLPSIQAVRDGEISKQAASHLLAEVYLAAGQFQNAVDAATDVIGDTNVRLMTTRFGTKSTVATGNVYWDLFQPGNQNRKGGVNLEGLWVIQFETDVLGGSSNTAGQPNNYLLERHVGPHFNLTPISPNPFVYPTSDLTGGRGVGWALSTRHFSNTIWQSDWNNDIRNANINFVRNIPSKNPASPFNGQNISTENPPAGITVPSRNFYAYQAKATTPGGHPAALYENAATGLLKNGAGGTYLDQYMFRLAETYFIRAEAYLGLNRKDLAANDINTVRARSNANPVLEANLDIDYILDERLRELGYEEKRRLTLMRLGLWYDRVTRFNPYYAAMALPHYNLWPIPQSEIERNNTAVLEQNPGYPR
ncbi:RagB/SusD family nutrient uptake outer membrane protein [Pedobacter xixiisoli]|uniref:Starch-binding associating with outer membrane n=1 Tax=Pedobacter xixiisoli TaxID=1476464 RepID=A0A285ZUM9_9SPHI|nr:RagB/SusD family nutrient uptake outer membrane protein [Pedobacter xixiisoli]SOD13361.1 Starch-binding associating with outer membrane [Pedobacter xixiisoli]